MEILEPGVAPVLVGFLFSVGLFATSIADANGEEPAYDDDWRHPIIVPGLVFSIGVTAEKIDQLLLGSTLPNRTGAQLCLGAFIARFVVVAAKIVRWRVE